MKLAAASPRPRPWLWFVGLYAAGVGTLAITALGLRALLIVLVQWGGAR